MKRVRILVYEGTRNEIERAIQYRNIKGRYSPRNGIVMDEHFVPDTHVVVEIDRAKLLRFKEASKEALFADPSWQEEFAVILGDILNGVYGGDVRV